MNGQCPRSAVVYAQGFPMDSSWSAIQEIISALGNENNGIYLQNVQDGHMSRKGKWAAPVGKERTQSHSM